MAAVACVVLMGQGRKPKDLEDLVAKSLTIKDAKGVMIVSLDKFGLSVGSKHQVTIGLTRDGSPMLSLCHKNRDVLLTPHGIDVHDKGRMSLGLNLVGKRGVPTLSFYDKAKHARVYIAALDGSPVIELADDKGNVRAAFGVAKTINKRTGAKTTTAENTLTMYDAKGTVIWQAPK